MSKGRGNSVISQVVDHAKAGMSYEEIGLLFNWKPSTVAVEVSRARSRGEDIPFRNGRRRLPRVVPAKKVPAAPKKALVTPRHRPAKSIPLVVLPKRLGVALYHLARKEGARVNLDDNGSLYFEVRVAWLEENKDALAKRLLG